MLLVGLTGGIGAGKSTVAAQLKERGAHVIDADQLAREAVAPGSDGLASLRDAFGPSILTSDGSLDRAALGQLVFKDEASRKTLESIVHPQVKRLSEAAIEQYRAAYPHGVVIYDIPLLVESKNSYDFDRVVVVSASPELRASRLVELRGMSPDEAGRRIAAQATEAERLAIATDVIDANGTLEETHKQVDSLWTELEQSAERS